ncbi:MAG: hypothetical protein M0R06_08210, partial [Sphaerochaeta sp.]|nr:hypothetical protein [Sphaerochaeta sp.]
FTARDHETKDLSGFEQDKVNLWLAQTFPRPEFQNYMAKELYGLLKLMGSGIEGKEYWSAFGQRKALLALLRDSKVQFEIEERKRKAKQQVEVI